MHSNNFISSICVKAAILVIEIDEVLVANMQSFGASKSISLK